MKAATVSLTVAGIVLASQIGFAPGAGDAAKPFPRLKGADRHFLVIAHRGFSFVAPENTIPAVQAAAGAGAEADMVELDVQRTKDARLVILHDKTLARTTNVASVFPSRAHDPISTFTLADVRKLDAGSWKGHAFAGTTVPTLGEVLRVLAPTHTNLLLELKNPHLYPGYEAQVAKVLAQYRFIQDHRVYVHSFSAGALAAFHAAAPTVSLGLLTMGGPFDLADYSWLQTINPAAKGVSAAMVDLARGDHLQVFTWLSKGTPDAAAELAELADDGVSGIISDRPDLARAELATGIP